MTLEAFQQIVNELIEEYAEYPGGVKDDERTKIVNEFCGNYQLNHFTDDEWFSLIAGLQSGLRLCTEDRYLFED